MYLEDHTIPLILLITTDAPITTMSAHTTEAPPTSQHLESTPPANMSTTNEGQSNIPSSEATGIAFHAHTDMNTENTSPYTSY